MDMNIQKYKAFVTTVSCGSFTKAAEILNYSQSGISRMIHDLEKEWKVILLKRSKLGVRLTSSGMKLLPYAENVCKEYEKLQTEVDELQGLKSGLIRIGTFSSVATHWLPNIIREFQKDYPEIDYEMLLGDYTEIEEWILEGRVDCGFLRLPTHAELDTVFLEQDRLLVVLPEGHPLAEYRKIPVSALCEEPFMLLEKGAKAEVSEIFERSHLTPKVHFTTWDDYAIMAMVEDGLGVSILPALILRRCQFDVAVRPLEGHPHRQINAIYRTADVSLAAARFLEYL